MQPYRILRSSRRTIALQVLPDGSIVVRCPRQMEDTAVHAFVESRKNWLQKQLARIPSPMLPLTNAELQTLIQAAGEDLTARLARFAPMLGVTFEKVTIRAQRTRWGSCSSKGNLSFNCLLMLAPEHVRDYVVVHELCHLRQMNHSPAFWLLVEQTMPDYDHCRKWLKEHGASLMARLNFLAQSAQK